MSYEVMGRLFNTRRQALTHLIAEFISAGGANDLETIKAALHESSIEDTVRELDRAWGGFCGVSLGAGEEPAGRLELANHMICNGADIIGATDPADVRERREQEEAAH